MHKFMGLIVIVVIVPAFFALVVDAANRIVDRGIQRRDENDEL